MSKFKANGQNLVHRPLDLHGSYYSAEYIFPGFPEQNELFSPTNLFMRNTNAGFQSLAITLETRAAEQMKK